MQTGEATINGIEHTKNELKVNNVSFGGEALVIIAGPCAVEGYDELMLAAESVQRAGARVLRGGAFKPRSSPQSFQGLGYEGLKILARVSKSTGLSTVTEVMAVEDVAMVADHVDILQIGSRNMHNYALLKAVGRTAKPVVLKRGLMATIDEWIQAAEYIRMEGNTKIILCERGIRSFDQSTRNTFDINCIPLVKTRTALPVIADPSHGTGVRSLVQPVACGAVAAGADGIMVEVHPEPEKALCDGHQSLHLWEFDALMQRLSALAPAVGRRLEQ